MQSFAEEAYPLRNNQVAFIDVLLLRVNKGWNQITTVGMGIEGRGEWPGHQRETYSRGRLIRNTMPMPIDRQRIRAILRAWKREISDRYLDVDYVRRHQRSSLSDVSTAFNRIRQNYPSGAVSFISQELNQSNFPVFIGSRLQSVWSYDSYFSNLLAWDDDHCFGLINELYIQDARTIGAGGSGLHYVWRAARNWLWQNRLNGVYASYGLPAHEPQWS